MMMGMVYFVQFCLDSQIVTDLGGVGGAIVSLQVGDDGAEDEEPFTTSDKDSFLCLACKSFLSFSSFSFFLKRRLIMKLFH